MFLGDMNSTVMSILHGASGVDDEQRKVFLERFCQTYSEPLIVYLSRSRKMSTEDACDLVQDFWLRKIIQPSPNETLIAKFLTAREKNSAVSFRGYLAKSLQRHWLNHYRSAASKQARSTAPLERLDGFEPADLDGDPLEFDDVWANFLFKQVLLSTRAECLKNGHELKWRVFLALVLVPSVRGERPPSYSELAKKLGACQPKTIGNAWMTVKRMIQRQFAIAVQDYLPAKSLAESVVHANEEVRRLMSQLASAGRLQIDVEEFGIELPMLPGRARFEMESMPNEFLFQSVADFSTVWHSVRSSRIREVFAMPKHQFSDVTFEQVLQDDCVTIEQLREIKQCSKQWGRLSDCADHANYLPKEIWGLIYLLCIALAEQRFGESVSSTDLSSLKERMRPFIDLEWIDPFSKSILEAFVGS